MEGTRWIGVALAAGVCGGLALGGCSSSDAEVGASTQTQAIVLGATSGAEHDAVVLLVVDKARSCTGTLVAPNMVLTARSCVAKIEPTVLCNVDGTAEQGGAILSTSAPEGIVVFTGQDAFGKVSNAANAAAKGKEIIAESKTTICDADLAFVVLDQSLGSPVAPLRLKSAPRKGETFTAVGWGLTETGKFPSKRMAKSGMVVTAIGPLPSGQKNIGLPPSEFVAGEGTCTGDSGAPAFAGSGAVFGVASRGAGDGCTGSTVVTVFTHLAQKSALVDRAFKASGFAPVEESTTDDPKHAADAGEDPAESPAGSDAEEGDDRVAASPPESQTSDGGCAIAGVVTARSSASATFGVGLALAAVVARVRRRERRS